jgi:hypothetical protein
MIYSIFSIGAILFSYSAMAQQQQQRVVPITIAEKTFRITYLPESQDIPTVARNFCIEQQAALGYTEANPLTTDNIAACATPVADYLTRAAAAQPPAPAPAPAGDLYTVTFSLSSLPSRPLSLILLSLCLR